MIMRLLGIIKKREKRKSLSQKLSISGLEAQLQNKDNEILYLRQQNEAYFTLLESMLNYHLHNLPIAEKLKLELHYSEDKNNFVLYICANESRRNFNIGYGRIIPREISLTKNTQEGMPPTYPRIYEHIKHLFKYTGFKLE